VIPAWLVDVLQRNGIVPAESIAEQIIEALPVGEITAAIRDSAAKHADQHLCAALKLASSKLAASFTGKHAEEVAEEDRPSNGVRARRAPARRGRPEPSKHVRVARRSGRAADAARANGRAPARDRAVGPRCSRCGQPGHNSRTCSEAKQVAATSRLREPALKPRKTVPREKALAEIRRERIAKLAAVKRSADPDEASKGAFADIRRHERSQKTPSQREPDDDQEQADSDDHDTLVPVNRDVVPRADRFARIEQSALERRLRTQGRVGEPQPLNFDTVMPID